MPIKHSGGDVKEEANYVNLEFMREIQAGDMHLAAYRWNLKQGDRVRSTQEWA